MISELHDFQKDVLETDTPVVVYFWASWCGPCQIFGPVYTQVSHAHPEIKFFKLNADENHGYLNVYGIQAIPTLLLFHQHKEIARIQGAMEAPAFESWLTEALI